MLESDYPHPDGTWPHTQKVVEEHIRHLSAENKTKVMRTNAEQLFHLDLPD
jgi:predicted TIM-barrel fold metal-dependent hydrolase